LSAPRPLKLAVVTPIPTPYRDGFWNVLAARPDVDLVVYYCAAGKGDRPWAGDWQRDFRREVLPGRNLMAWRGVDASAWDNPEIGLRLWAEAPDAVLLGGYNHPTMLRAMRVCTQRGLPYFLMCESHLRRPRSPMRRLLKNRFLRRIVASMAGGLPTGSLAHQYLLHYGATKERLFSLPNTPDVEHIYRISQTLRENRAVLRKKLGFSDRPNLLFVGRLIRNKGAHTLIRAVATIPAARRPDLVLLGDGPERNGLADLAADLGISAHVRFAGFVEPSETINWYVACDVFVLPSSETWGVVVAEALSAGLPVIVADTVGSHPDLVGDRHVGKVVTGSEPRHWADAILQQLEEAVSAQEISDRWGEVRLGLAYDGLSSRLTDYLEAMLERGSNSHARCT
jgi:glycosyltransferase involved in cell wall biosynthesis